MQHLTKEHVTKLKDSLLLINAIIIIYNASLFLLSTKYISIHHYARDFLNKVSYITRSPQNIFFESLFLFIIIVLLMKFREKENLKIANGFVYIEIILSFLLIIRLNGSYNGILLFVFADLLYNMRNIKHMALLLLMAFGLLLISDFNILSNIIHMPSIESYLSFYPNSSRTFMLFTKNILASLNVVLFILYLVCQVLVQQEETKKISKELQLASKVNDELKTYSALSEKMAEDKERKRISREIHDTLGHALTGISAGIDACIALIDIDKQKRQELALKNKAEHDGLTGLYNRSKAINEINQILLSNEMTCGALLMLDMNDFKEINDNYGHAIGDKIITKTAKRLKEMFRNDDILCRLGGDEFMILCRNIDEISIRMKLEDVTRQMKIPYLIEEYQIMAPLSIGFVMIPLYGTTFNNLYKKADIALYKAKQDGLASYRMYHDDMNKKAL